MKAEITNENRRKFEALYFDQPVFWSCKEPLESNNILDARKLARPFSKYDMLELKPLSSISDKDAELICKHHRVVSSDDKWSVNSMITLDGYSTDYLRSRGYALPWMGLSVEELESAGWIKLVGDDK